MTSPGTSSPCRRGDPLSIAFHPGLDRQLGLQGGDGAARLAFLPESDHGVGEQQHQDDAEVRPVLQLRPRAPPPLRSSREWDPRNRPSSFRSGLTFFSSISFGPYWVSRFCASACVRPSGDDRSRFSTSAMGRDLRSSFASGFDSAAGSPRASGAFTAGLASGAFASSFDRPSHRESWHRQPSRRVLSPYLSVVSWWLSS